MTTKKVKAAPPSSAEIALQEQQAALLKEQTAILQQQKRNQDILLPILSQQFGLKINTDDDGNITGVEQLDPEGDARRREIQKLQEERSLAALKGELPVDPVLERDLQAQEQTLRERLAAQFGPGYETSSAGIETLDAFMRTAEGLRYGARTGAMTLAEQLALARQAANTSAGTNAVAALSNQTLGQALGLAGAMGQAAAGFGQAQQPYQFTRQLQTEASAQNAKNFNAMMAGIGKLAGTVAFSPMAGTPVGAMFSDEALKENVRKIGTTLNGLGIYIYNYVGDSTTRIGLMAQEVMRVRPDAVHEEDGYLKVNYGAI